MKDQIIKYQLVCFFIFTITLIGCGAADFTVEDVKEENRNYQVEEKSAVEESSSEDTLDSKSINAEKILIKKWKNKARQQLESIEDLTLILKDETLEKGFRNEIEKELNTLYKRNDTTNYSLTKNDVKFKNFKKLTVHNGDTLSLLFKNKKEELNAKFILHNESKKFGDNVEMVEQLKLISIKKIN